MGISKHTVLAGESYTVSWNSAQLVNGREEFEGQSTRNFGQSGRSVTLSQSQPGLYTYIEKRCHSTCSESRNSIRVKPRMCTTLGDFYTSSGCEVGGVKVNIYPAEGGKKFANKLFYIVGPYSLGETFDINSLIPTELKNEQVDIAYFDFELSNFESVASKSVYLTRAIKLIDSLRGAAEPAVITGISLGGVVARHSLVSMEDEGYLHGFEEYISIDAPHLGAHIPLSLQYIPQFIKNATNRARRDNNGGIINE